MKYYLFKNGKIKPYRSKVEITPKDRIRALLTRLKRGQKIIKCSCGNLFKTFANSTAVCPYCGKRIKVRREVIVARR